MQYCYISIRGSYHAFLTRKWAEKTALSATRGLNEGEKLSETE